MDGGRTHEKVSLTGPSVITRAWSAISKTAAVLAAVMRFLAKASDRMAAGYHAATRGLERLSRWSNSKATGVPLAPVGADLAPEEWEEPVLLPLAPEPPPLPPAAFKHGPTPAEEAEWAIALEAAKVATETALAKQAAESAAAAPSRPAPAPRSPTPQPIRRTGEVAVQPIDRSNEVTPPPVRRTGEVAVQPVRKTAEVAAQPGRPAAESTPLPARRTGEVALQPSRRTVEMATQPARQATEPTPQPTRRTAELRVGPKAAAARTIEPRMTRPSSSQPVAPAIDPQVAAATKKTIAAALRS